MARIVLLMGATGAGKSEVAGRLVARNGFHHLSSGRILREHLSDHPQLSEGKLVTSSQVEEVIDAAVGQLLDRNDAPTRETVILLDGFPRTFDQALWLRGHLSTWNAELWRAIHLEINLETSLLRLSRRARADDSPEAIAEKWREYNSATSPMITWYENEGLLARVPADGTPEQVYNLVIQELGL